MSYLYGLIGLLVGGLFFYKNKASSAEAINKNVDVKNALNKEDSSVAKSEGLLESEAQKRDDISKEVEKETANEQAIEELAKFFNSRKPS